MADKTKILPKKKTGKRVVKAKKPVKKVPVKHKETKKEKNLLKPLTEKQKAFCREYVFDWNASRAYKAAYPNVTDGTARANSSDLLTNTNIQQYCFEIQKDLEKLCGISKAMIINEHKKLAFSSIAYLHNTWIERKEFDQLTDEQKLCIEEISTKIQHKIEWEGDGDKRIPVDYTVEYVKIKLYSKQRSLESISKMQGYDAPTKVILGGGLSNDLKIGFE